MKSRGGQPKATTSFEEREVTSVATAPLAGAGSARRIQGHAVEPAGRGDTERSPLIGVATGRILGVGAVDVEEALALHVEHEGVRAGAVRSEERRPSSVSNSMYSRNRAYEVLVATPETPEIET